MALYEEREAARRIWEFWPGGCTWWQRHLRFHAVYWPAFLMAAGRTTRAMLPTACGSTLPRKMSKTLGNTVELDVLNRHFPIDAIRYFCLRDMGLADGRFGYKR